MGTPARRGRREKTEPGIYRNHGVACPRSRNERSSHRCQCPWVVSIPGPGGTRQKSLPGHLSRQEVREARAVLARQARTSARLPADHRSMTMRELSVHYLRMKAASTEAASVENEAADYRFRIDPVFGQMRVQDITRAACDIYFAELRAGWPPQLILREDRSVPEGGLTPPSQRGFSKTINTFKRMLAYGAEVYALPNNAAELDPKPLSSAEDPPTTRVLSKTDHALLYAKGFTSLRVRSMVMAALELALRKGEVIGAPWTALDLDAGTFLVKQAAYQRRGERNGHATRIIKGTKGRRRRLVYLSDHLIEVMRAWYEESVVRGGADPKGLIWPGRNGEPMEACAPNHALERALRRCGLGAPDKRITFHGLRHTGATRLFEKGRPLTEISLILGHKNTWVTATIYEHFTDRELLREARHSFDGLAPDDLDELVKQELRDT